MEKGNGDSVSGEENKRKPTTRTERAKGKEGDTKQEGKKKKKGPSSVADALVQSMETGVNVLARHE